MLKDARRCAIHAKRRPERAGAHHPAGDSRGGDRHGNLCLWWRQPRLSRDEARARSYPAAPALDSRGGGSRAGGGDLRGKPQGGGGGGAGGAEVGGGGAGGGGGGRVGGGEAGGVWGRGRW